MMKKLIVEGLGTFLLVLFILLMASEHDVVETAIGVGFVLMGLIYAGGPISQAHYNPAVTLAFWLRNKISTSLALGYVLVQSLSAVIAAKLFAKIVGFQTLKDLALATPHRSSFPTPELVSECLGTSFLVFVILRVATANSTKGNSYYGLAIGTTVAANIIAFGSFSNAIYNPAVTLAFSVDQIISWKVLDDYILTQFFAAFMAWIVYRLTADVRD